MNTPRPLGIVIPTRWEAKPVISAFHLQKDGEGFFRGTIGDRSVIVSISGVGKVRAADAANRLVSAGAKELVSMGFCGALVESLHIGDLVTDRIATVDRPVRTLQERQVLTQKANANAVDMETQAVIEAGTRRGVPISILRVVSDECGDDLSPLFGSDGEFAAWKIALRLLNPSVWPLAGRLKRNSAIAGRRLVEELRAFCSATPSLGRAPAPVGN